MFDHDDFGVDDDDTNPSDGPSLDDIIALALSRRRLLKMGSAAVGLGFMAGLGGTTAVAAGGSDRKPPKGPTIGFTSVPLPLVAQKGVTVPPGYTAEVLFAWGDPVSNGPAWVPDASQGWQEQEQQAGMHHDGIAFFPINHQRGLLCINHEYTDTGLLFTDLKANWSPDKSKKLLAAHGVSVIEVRRVNGRRTQAGRWQVVRPSRFGRRITGYTPMRVVGPAAGSEHLKTAADPTGTMVLGTLNNCGGSATPWGTYVTGEENYDFYFRQPAAADLTPEERRYMQSALSGVIGVHVGDPRFDMLVEGNRNEPNRFGYMVEIDPFDPRSTPIKLTGLGRYKHEMAAVRLTSDGRAVAYSGDDERNNYIYKFVGSRTVRQARRAKQSPLEEGTLYVARFSAGGAEGDMMGVGEWIPLTTDNPMLAGWTNDRIHVFTRLAADAVGATRMDRPEWISVAPDGQVYATLTNNTRRGRATTNPTEARGLVESFVVPNDDANPRGGAAGNPYGQIVRWTEQGDADALTFTWDVFVLAGDPANPAGLPAGLGGAPAGGNVQGDICACPDAVTVDRDGRVWIGTDMFSTEAGVGAYANLKNNTLLAADPATKEFRRFLVGPAGCEVTGITFTPEGRAMFVDIQHPGEPPEIFTHSLANVLTDWPDGGGARPRSATLVITKDDGGVIGT
ncbi:MAG: PhoX family protein [Actinomycetes bacterium]